MNINDIAIGPYISLVIVGRSTLGHGGRKEVEDPDNPDWLRLDGYNYNFIAGPGPKCPTMDTHGSTFQSSARIGGLFSGFC